MKINASEIKKYLVYLCAITCVFGERINDYLPFGTLWFTFFGGLLVLANVLFPPKIGKRYTPTEKSGCFMYVILLGITFLVSLLSITFSYGSLSNEIRQGALALIAFNIVLVLVEYPTLIVPVMKVFCVAFTVSFIISFGFVYKNTSRRTGFFKDPNSMARMAAVSLFFCLILLSRGDKNSTRDTVIESIVFVVAAFAIFLSGSRGVLLGCGLSVLYLLCFTKVNKKFKKIILIGIGSAAILLIIMAFIVPPITELAKRFLGLEKGDGYASNIRWSMWGSYLENVTDYFLIGNFDKTPVGYFGKYASSHNSLIEMMVTHGVFAFLAYCMLLIQCFAFKTGENSCRIYLKCLFIALFCSSMFIATNDEKITWLSISLLLMPESIFQKELLWGEGEDIRLYNGIDNVIF